MSVFLVWFIGGLDFGAAIASIAGGRFALAALLMSNAIFLYLLRSHVYGCQK